MRALAAIEASGLVFVVACAARRPPTAAEHLRPRVAAACNASSDERLVVDWSPLERARLEAAVRKGLVMLRVDGCSIEIAPFCTARRGYVYAATSRQREVTTLRDRDEIEAQLPLGAARFGGLVGRKSAIEVSMTVVGRYESSTGPLSITELEGECRGVTHAVASLSVGSFAIDAADEASVEANAGVVLASARAESQTERRHLDRAGVEARCAEARRTDANPPEDCGVPLRVEVRTIGDARVARAMDPTSPSAPTPEQGNRFAVMLKGATVPCYRAARDLYPNLAGSLTLMVTVGANGAVRRISEKHDIPDVPDPLADCIVRRTQQLSFPTEGGHATQMFMVPLTFAPKR